MVCVRVPASLRAAGTRGTGGKCEYGVFLAVYTPKSHEIAEKCETIFSSERAQTRSVRSPWGVERAVAFSKACDAASACTAAVFGRAAPRSSTPRAASSSLQRARKRPQLVADARGHSHATRRGEGTRGTGGTRECTGSEAMYTLESHEIAEKQRTIFVSEHAKTCRARPPRRDEYAVVFTRPSGAVSARTAAIFRRAAPTVPRAPSSAFHSAGKRRSHRRACVRVHAPRRSEGPRPRGGICDYVRFAAVYPPAIRMEWPRGGERFCPRDRAEARRGRPP